MSTGIIELNDSGLRLNQADRPPLDSPGFALITEQNLLLGDAARRQARLHPLQTNNQFWQRLNLDPLNNANPNCRHHADLAFNHLREIRQLAQEIEEVIFAIPGHFSREQLSLLLGIAQACDFNAVGLVDSATAALAPHVGRGHFLHVDIQLHQTVISHLEANQAVTRGQVETIPGVGIIALYDAWAQLLAEQFILHTRFDPLHSADTEQQLYDALPDFLEQCRRAGEATLALGEHKVALPQHKVREKVAPLYERILQKLSQPCDRIYLSDRWRQLPGFSETLSSAQLLEPDAIAAGCQLHESLIRGQGEHLSFVTQLPVTTSPKQSEDATTERANYLLCDHQAYPAEQPLYIVKDNGQPRLSTAASEQALGQIVYRQGNLSLEQIDGSGLTLNNKAAHNGHTLHCGDQLSLPGSDGVITAIRVHPQNNSG